MRSLFSEHKKFVFVFFVLTFLFYGNSLKNKYALDDDYITVTNFEIKGQQYIPNHVLVSQGFKGIPKIWQTNYSVSSEGSFDYRPVTTSSFAMEYGIFGQNPFISHLINILLYGLTVCVLFFLVLTLLKEHEYKHNVAFIASLIFLIHPIHTEVVDNLKCRDELLASLFPLIALFYSLSAYDKPTIKNCTFVFLGIFLGMFSKPSGILFFAVIPLCIVFFKKPEVKKILTLGSVLMFTYLLSILLKGSFISDKEIRVFYGFENPLFNSSVSFFQKIIIAFKTLGFYIKSLLYPLPFRNYYGTNTFDVSPSINFYFFLGFGFVAAGSYYILKTRNKLFFFSFLFFLGTIFPFLNFITPVAGVVGERLVYMASIAFCLMTALLLIPYVGKAKLQPGTFLSRPYIYTTPLLLICMVIVWNRNTNWYNKLTLFEHDIKYLEKSAKANSLLGNEYFEMLSAPEKKYPIPQIIQKALTHYNKAIAIDSSFFTAYNNAGVLYFKYMNDIPNAERYFKLAVRHKDGYYQAYENLGNCFNRNGNIAAAEEMYKKSILINPMQYTAYISWIKILFEQKEYEKSAKLIDIAALTFKNNYELTVMKGNSLFMRGEKKEALVNFEKGYDILPNKELAGFIASKYLEVGDTAKYTIYINK